MRQEYKNQLLNPNCEGTYTYGNRTRKHFGIDQLDKAIEFLRANPRKTFVVQRFDYVADMTLTENPVLDVAGNVIRTRIEATHDPCLTHDIYFIANERLQCFHIARAHNVVNAYPENIFGLHDAYDHTISDALRISLGDMFMLSSRANILLLTEEQKAKKLIAEPSKPVSVLDTRLGPVLITEQFPAKGIAYLQTKLNIELSRPEHEELSKLENYKGVNLIEKAASYLKRKGTKHNNPIIGTFDPEKQNQDCRLVFFQCNQSGKELHATAVFLHGSKETLHKDTALCNYLASQFSNKTELPLGNLFLLYVPVQE
ncbi:MAG: hypothetical protein Q7K43_00925, partial [Candidatus Woesearchaeota archaeon]|nr:hypothetical protein [Candidatus Woesearchaeota archaeon]